MQPDPQVRVNCMVARSDTPDEAGHGKHEHSETKLSNLAQLLTNFETKYGLPPAMHGYAVYLCYTLP